MDIVIIGAGASGMMAALTAVKAPDCRVILLERQSRVGRKLAATGNGRCNLSNVHADPSHYFGDNPTFCAPVLDALGVDQTLDFFAGLGLATVTEPSGKVYPFSDQANSVVDVLRLALEQSDIQLELDCEVTKIWKKADGYLVKTKNGDFFGNKLILACGGKACEKLGGTDLGYGLAKSLGHRATPFYPSLVQLTCHDPRPALKGIRTKANITVTCGTSVVDSTAGEVQFTETGLSGPAMFEVSRTVSTCHRPLEIHLDLVPHWDEATCLNRLIAKVRALPNLMADQLLTGILHNRLGQLLVKSAGISPATPLKTLSTGQLEALVSRAKDWTFSPSGTTGFPNCQVTVGGLDTADFCPETMESRKNPDLYVCGELLDVDGDCGGFNLQWAWSSGYVAGLHASKRSHT
ncbi:MAG: NAD(P)/FAD-dependent oxidoreductase [Eubacteriales bacterium]